MIKTTGLKKQKGFLFLIIIIAAAALAAIAAYVQPGISNEAGRVALANVFQCAIIAIIVFWAAGWRWAG
jgi:hypothetical protein